MLNQIGEILVASDMLSSALWVWAYTLIFALLHSITAMDSLKRRVYKLGLAVHHYRLLYSIFAVVTTLVWLFFIHALPDTPLYHIQGFWRYMFYVIQGLGMFMALAALAPIDGAAFLGLKALDNQGEGFVIQGVYKYIRHPMYAGVMLYLLFKPEQSVVSLHFALAVSLYFIVGSRLEEKRMLKANPDYIDYQQQVGAFVPKFWDRS